MAVVVPPHPQGALGSGLFGLLDGPDPAGEGVGLRGREFSCPLGQVPVGVGGGDAGQGTKFVPGEETLLESSGDGRELFELLADRHHLSGGGMGDTELGGQPGGHRGGTVLPPALLGVEGGDHPDQGAAEGALGGVELQDRVRQLTRRKSGERIGIHALPQSSAHGEVPVSPYDVGVTETPLLGGGLLRSHHPQLQRSSSQRLHVDGHRELLLRLIIRCSAASTPTPGPSIGSSRTPAS